MPPENGCQTFGTSSSKSGRDYSSPFGSPIARLERVILSHVLKTFSKARFPLSSEIELTVAGRLAVAVGYRYSRLTSSNADIIFLQLNLYTMK